MALDFQSHAVNHPLPARRRKARGLFLKTLDYASECSCKHVTILVGAKFEGESRKESLNRAVDELNWRLEKARAEGLVLGVEAHVGSLTPRPKSAAQLMQRVPGLTLTLDYTHFTRVGLPDADIEPLLDYASHFHVRGARKGRLQTRFDDNVIDYERIIAQLGKRKYRGWIGLEYVWQDWERCNEWDNLCETILFRDFFRELAA